MKKAIRVVLILLGIACLCFNDQIWYGNAISDSAKCTACALISFLPATGLLSAALGDIRKQYWELLLFWLIVNCGFCVFLFLYFFSMARIHTYDTFPLGLTVLAAYCLGTGLTLFLPFSWARKKMVH